MRLNGNVAFSACSLRFSIADSRRNGEKMQDGLVADIRRVGVQHLQQATVAAQR